MSSCARKEIAEIDILVTASNVDLKIMKPIRIRVGIPWDWGSGTSSASLDEHLPRYYV